MRWCYRPSVPLGRTEGTPPDPKKKRESARKVTLGSGDVPPMARPVTESRPRRRVGCRHPYIRRGHAMRMLRMLAATSAAALTGLAMAGTAHATEQADGPLAVTVDECTVTVTAAEMPVHISSGLRTAGLAVRVDGEVTATEPVPTDEATGVVTESVTVGPLTSDTTVEYRWFGGPIREHDWPTWDTESHPDWVDVVEAREADKG